MAIIDSSLSDLYYPTNGKNCCADNQSNVNTCTYIMCFYYAPNFEEVMGAYWFGPLSICLSVMRNAVHTVKNG